MYNMQILAQQQSLSFNTVILKYKRKNSGKYRTNAELDAYLYILKTIIVIYDLLE